jgi:hypothetical protein
MEAAECGHAAALRALSRPELQGLEVILSRETWHIS